MHVNSTKKSKKSLHVRCWRDSKRGLVFSRLAVREILGICDRHTINRHCGFSGVFEDALSVEQIIRIALLNRWIRLGYGEKHGRPYFNKLWRTNQLEQAFQEFNLSLEDEINQINERIKNYEDNQWRYLSTAG